MFLAAAAAVRQAMTIRNMTALKQQDPVFCG